jgi:hypothetical protein
VSDGSDFVFGTDKGSNKRATAPDPCLKFTYDEEEKKHYETILASELESNQIFRAGWEKARQNLAKKDGLEENEFLAVYTYSVPSPLVAKEFNKKTRTLGPNNPNYDFKAMYYFLSAAINKISPKTAQEVYRGVTHPVTATVGNPFNFENFASTTGDLAVAEIYSGSPGPGTVFVIETILGAKIDRFSAISDEDEVLISPCEKFKVLKVLKVGEGRQEIHLKSLGMTA